jgi:hypothetical protein
MNVKELNDSLVALMETRQKLLKLNYDDERYDDLEEQLHDQEDDFNERFGPYLEDVLEEIHEKVCPDTDVLLPTAYLPESFKGEGEFTPSSKDGIFVEAEEYPDKDARLTLVPSPVRIILTVGKSVHKEVWKAS